MADNYEDELTWAIDAVSQAAVICRNVQNQITSDVMVKKDRSPVTVADFASQAVICRHLLAHAPDDEVVGEEDAAELRKAENAPFLDRIREELLHVGIEPEGDEIRDWIDRGNASGGSGRFWTLDPIDGTKGFVSKRQYAISLALIVDGQIEVGVLGCPNLPVSSEHDQPAGVLMTAVRGRGTLVVPLDDLTDGLAGRDHAPQAGRLNEIESGAPAASVAVSRTEDPADARFCESAESGHSSHGRSAEIAALLGITRPALRLDSQAKYATVARGDADIYFRLPTRKGYREKIWDHAGGVLVVEEAGGTVTDVNGKPLEFHHGSELIANRGILVTNGHLHERVLKAVAATSEPDTQ